MRCPRRSNGCGIFSGKYFGLHHIITLPITRQRVRDAIISGLAVSGFKDDKAWFDAPKNSAVTRLVLEAHEKRQAQIRTEQHQQITEIETRNMATNYYGLVNLFVGRFMAMASGGRDHAVNILDPFVRFSDTIHPRPGRSSQSETRCYTPTRGSRCNTYGAWCTD